MTEMLIRAVDSMWLKPKPFTVGLCLSIHICGQAHGESMVGFGESSYTPAVSVFGFQSYPDRLKNPKGNKHIIYAIIHC